MTNIKVGHVYDNYPLYSLLLGRTSEWKAHEAMAASTFLQDAAVREKMKDPFIIAEPFAGKSEHADYFKRYCTWPISKYDTSDVLHNQVDAIYDPFPKGTNCVLSYYYSLDTLIDKKLGRYYSSRASVFALLSNIHRTLSMSKVGLAYFHLNADSEEDMHTLAFDDIVGYKETIPFGHPIRQLFGLTPHDLCDLHWDEKREYDRMMSCNVHVFKNIRVKSRTQGKVGTFTIDKPFYQRTWSNSEIVDMALEIGYSGIHFYRAEQDIGFTYTRLPTKITPKTVENCPEIDEEYKTLANGIVLVCRKTVK